MAAEVLAFIPARSDSVISALRLGYSSALMRGIEAARGRYTILGD
jgi:hypothetical protein